jgi:hypothetical protein
VDLMAAQDVIDSIRTSYKKCQIHSMSISVGKDGSAEAGMTCSCDWYFNGTGPDLDSAMLRMRIQYIDYHDKHYTKDKRE